jgi:hypothetical protein
MAPILFICHDTGNTNVMLQTAKHLLELNPDEDIKFLVIGAAADLIFSKPENQFLADKVIRLTSWLEEKDLHDFSKINLRPLSDDEMGKVATNLEALKPAAAITGCSSGLEARAPFQIAKLLTTHLPLDANYIYNGDFFQDVATNPFWTCLSEEWIEKLSLMVAFTTAVQQVKDKNEKAMCYLTGSSALDDVLEAKKTPEEIADIRDTLEVKPEQELVFVAGSKFVNDDLKLLNCLAKSIQQHPETAVRMGMHPGTSDAPGYAQKILDWLNEKEIANLKLVVNKKLAAKLPESLSANKYIKIDDISGDKTFPAISAMASSLPSTLSTQTIMRQLPSFCLKKYKARSYMAEFFAQSSEELFQARAKDQQKLDRIELGLPAGRTVEIIGEKLTTASRLRR